MKANRTRRGFSPCCVAAAALLLMGSDIMRGLVQEEQRLWICAERWTSHHHKGYLEGRLKESDVFLIDLSDGEILFQDRAGEDEFYLTSNGTRCYFYAPGKEEQEKLFGLLKTPARNAEIYYRDTSDWGEEHTVYTFDSCIPGVSLGLIL